MARGFNATSDLITIDGAASFSEQTPYWMACWVKQLSGGVVRAVYSEMSLSSTSPFLVLETSGGGGNPKMQTVVRNDAGGGGQVSAVSTAGVFDGVWHHIAYTHDGSGNWLTYIDGALDANGSFVPGVTTCNAATIGASRTTTTTKFFAGSVAHLAKGAALLSATDAARLARGLSPLALATLPDHYWPLYGLDSPEIDLGAASPVTGALTGTTPVSGPIPMDSPDWIASLGRRPVPMIKGPDTDKLLGMRGIYR